MTIVKVQIPLMSTDPNVQYLVYAKGRTNMVEQPIPKKVLQAIRQSSSPFKGYFDATWDSERNRWDIHNYAPWQDW